MSYMESWLALSARIKGLQAAGELYARFQGYHQEDNYGAGRYLREQCGAAVDSLQRFRQHFAGSLPDDAITLLDNFLASAPARAAREPSTAQRGARGALVVLAALEAEITFVLTGRQEQIRARSERAFMLLQRMLAVDADVQSKWAAALMQGEVACERLGAVHLLSQGIYAFKIDAIGARSDLVIPELPHETVLSRSVEGLVLTEWKVATAVNAAAKFAEARAQADLYSQGAMAGIELADYRYLVAVSENELPPAVIPGDSTAADGVVYRHINIVVAPSLPSMIGRRRARGRAAKNPNTN